MKNLIIVLLLLIVGFVNAQMGVGVTVPTVTLDVKSNATTETTKALEINNSSNVSVAELRNNGNFIFSGALMPDGDAGEIDEVLVSGGVGQTPVWKKIEVPAGTKIITQVYNARRNTVSETIVNANTEYRLDFPTLYIQSLPSIGSWNNTFKEFTVAKAGLYHITSGVRAYDVGSGANGIMRINTTSYVQPFNGQRSQGGTPLVTSLNFTGEIIVPMNVGDKIWVTTKNDSSWKQSNSYLHIKFSEL